LKTSCDIQINCHVFQFYETYDDECIGDIPQIEIDGVISTEHFTEKREIMMLLGLKEEE